MSKWTGGTYARIRREEEEIAERKLASLKASASDDPYDSVYVTPEMLRVYQRVESNT